MFVGCGACVWFYGLWVLLGLMVWVYGFYDLCGFMGYDGGTSM